MSEFDYTSSLRDPKEVIAALVECMVEKDIDSFREIVVAHLNTVSKSKFSKETKIGRRTIYDLMDESKPFNPSLTTVSSIFKSIAQEKKEVTR